MTKKFSFFIALSIASLIFLLSVTTMAAKAAVTSAPAQQFMSPQEIAAQLSANLSSGSPASRAPASGASAFTTTHELPPITVNATVDLRAYDSPVVSQFGGTCSAFATASVMENVLKSRGIHKLVSHRDLWNFYGVYDSDAAIEAAKKNYITELQYWPDNARPTPDYKEHRSLKITQTTHHQYDYQAAIRALDQRHPLVMAVRVPQDLSNCKPTISANSRRTKGHHVLAAVGYQLDSNVPGGGYFIMKNSWGADCGDRGYHYYPFALCKRNDLYCYFIEVDAVEAR